MVTIFFSASIVPWPSCHHRGNKLRSRARHRKTHNPLASNNPLGHFNRAESKSGQQTLNLLQPIPTRWSVQIACYVAGGTASCPALSFLAPPKTLPQILGGIDLTFLERVFRHVYQHNLSDFEFFLCLAGELAIG